jgi:hypothetical protein
LKLQQGLFKNIQQQTGQICTEFRKNLAIRRGIWITPDELEGVPPSLISRLGKGEGENEGKLLAKTIDPGITTATNSETQKSLGIESKNPLQRERRLS